MPLVLLTRSIMTTRGIGNGKGRYTTISTKQAVELAIEQGEAMAKLLRK